MIYQSAHGGCFATAAGHLFDRQPISRKAKQRARLAMRRQANLFHLLAYNVTAGVNDSNVDMTASAADPSFGTRNSHYILFEPYMLLAGVHVGVSVLRARFNVASLNAILQHHFWNVNRSATIPSPVNIEDLRDRGLPLPMAEEIAIQESGNLGAGNEQENTFLVIAPPEWNLQIPAAQFRVVARFTASPTAGNNTWGAFAAITMESTIRGGYYSVVGAEVEGTNLLAFQINFPRMPMTRGRKLFPGWVGMNAIGNVPAIPGVNRNWLGHWGTFHSFELPTISAYGTTAGAITCEGRFDLLYHGESPPAGVFGGPGVGTGGTLHL